jgi:two-component system, LytTR family, sensor kinase
VVGGLVAIPAMMGGEFLSLPLLTAVGALGGLLRDAARDPEDIWRFSPSFDLNIYRLFRRKYDRRLTLYHLAVFLTILFAEFLRLSLGHLFGGELVFYLYPSTPNPWLVAAVYATTLFATVLPLKIWNNTRIERKLDEQQRVLMQARLDALTSQINPHFLFNTLNSVSSLIRTDPHKARTMVLNLSRILRRLMRKHENFTPLREELKFIEDYLAIEMVRFGDKLRVQTSIDPETVDRLVPSMLLQPLIENSVKHGLGSKVDGGTLKLSSRFSNGRLHLVVEDDGVGIPEAKLAHLFEKGIGVSNVNERLKVLFGAEYRMWIDSKPDEGTRIEIEIPDVQGGPPLLAGGELQKVSSF